MSRKLRSFLSSFEARRRGSHLAIFVVLASIFHALATPWLGSKFPKFFKNGYELLFFDASLSFAEKIAQWRTEPVTSLQLVTTVLMLSLLAVGVASIAS